MRGQGVEGSGVCWNLEEARPLPRKKIIFCPQNDKFWCILPQFLIGRKHGQKPLDTDFNGKTKLTKTVQKLSKNSRSDKGGGGRTIAPPEYATVSD